QVGDITAEDIREVLGGNRQCERRRFAGSRAKFRQVIKALEVVWRSATRALPAVRLIGVVAREGGGRPVVTFGAGSGVDKESIQQPKTQRERALIGSYVQSPRPLD